MSNKLEYHPISSLSLCFFGKKMDILIPFTYGHFLGEWNIGKKNNFISAAAAVFYVCKRHRES